MKNSRDKQCLHCGLSYGPRTDPTGKARPERWSEYCRRRYCSQRCSWESRRKEHKHPRNSRKEARKLALTYSSICCFCGEFEPSELVVHHADGDPHNNEWNNLVVMCGDCHKLFHAMAERLRAPQRTSSWLEGFKAGAETAREMGQP